MPGIRITHDEWHNCRVAISHPFRKVKPRFEADGRTRVPCHSCTSSPLNPVVHERKTIHLDFDTDGNAFVSPESLKFLLEAGMHNFGLKLANEVDNPPDQILHLAGSPVAFTREIKEYGGSHPRLHVLKNKLFGAKE